MIKPLYITNAIKGVSAVAVALTVLSPFYQYNGSLQSIQTSFIHLPCALFGIYAVFVTLPINTKFASLACLFLVINWAVI